MEGMDTTSIENSSHQPCTPATTGSISNACFPSRGGLAGDDMARPASRREWRTVLA